jgi:competence protein ComEA
MSGQLWKKTAVALSLTLAVALGVSLSPTATGQTTATKKTKAAPKPAAKARIDLNKATAEELETLPGIGPAHARDIIAARPFRTVDDLARVRGLGEARVDAIRDLVVVSPPAGAPATKTKTAATRPPVTAPAAPAAKTATTPPARTTTAVPPATKAQPKVAQPTAGRLVNINTASKEELDALPGIGEVKSQAIIEGRPFKTIEDIMKVKGIKEGEFSKIKDLITVK